MTAEIFKIAVTDTFRAEQKCDMDERRNIIERIEGQGKTTVVDQREVKK